MNETLHPARWSDVPWPTSDDRMRVADTSMVQAASPPGGGPAAEAEARPATTQAPRNTRNRRDARDGWVERARHAVRQRPMVGVAAAFVLGSVIARIVR